jgi:hypothetical protein
LPCRQSRREQLYGPPRVVEVGDDETRTCCDCGTKFVLTTSEQQWLRDRQFARLRRCRPCRRQRSSGRE